MSSFQNPIWLDNKNASFSRIFLMLRKNVNDHLHIVFAIIRECQTFLLKETCFSRLSEESTPTKSSTNCALSTVLNSMRWLRRREWRESSTETKRSAIPSSTRSMSPPIDPISFVWRASSSLSRFSLETKLLQYASVLLAHRLGVQEGWAEGNGHYDCEAQHQGISPLLGSMSRESAPTSSVLSWETSTSTTTDTTSMLCCDFSMVSLASWIFKISSTSTLVVDETSLPSVLTTWIPSKDPSSMMYALHQLLLITL